MVDFGIVTILTHYAIQPVDLARSVVSSSGLARDGMQKRWLTMAWRFRIAGK